MSAHYKFVVWFHEVDKHDIPIVGGKGANLGEMTQAKLPVPPGFIVTATAYHYFMDRAGIKTRIKKLLENLDYNDAQKLQRVSKEVRKLIREAPVPRDVSDDIIEHYLKLAQQRTAYDTKGDSFLKNLGHITAAHEVPVAVRSSATAEDLPEASFAGQQETFLNIAGEANLIEAVRKAWASLFTARAVFYRHDHGFDHFKVAIAIPVQKMVESEVSGVMFTVDPVSNDKTKLIIEAIYGLGELIVQGAVTPDQYVLDKASNKILHKTIGEQEKYMPGTKQDEEPVPTNIRGKQKLPDEYIHELARIGKRIEQHYYFPQDIEWAFEDKTLFVVQTRPITTLEHEEVTSKDVEKLMRAMKEIAEGDPASPGIASGKVAIVTAARYIYKVNQGDILVAEQTNPDFVPAMKKASAIVTQKGGRTSHAAIVSRELGLPAVVGVEDILRKVKEDMEITVDGSKGIIYKGIAPTVVLQSHTRPTGSSEHLKTATKIYCNLAEVSRAKDVSQLNVDGVGLLRAEFMLADIGVHPKWILEQGKKVRNEFIAHLAEKIAVFCESFGPQRPVIYRTTDFKTNEYKNLKHGAQYEDYEENPMLGYRGASRYVADPDVFELELEAIRTVRTKMNLKNLHVMIPFVRTPEELTQTKRIMAAAHLLRSPSFKLWMMVELPVNVIMLEDFIKVGIDGVSIGSNDLTQLTLGVDRDNSRLAHSFNEMNPAVLWSLERIITTCHTYKVTTSICGQAPSDYPELVEKLVNWGTTSISVNPDVIDSVRLTVYNAEKKLIKK
ncbi:MAG: phosphoenolpyruvate synthase [Candidatus Roizmanbacteria bacterium]|nr:phosphoenolpyruvate synthase [Candidatus Roizmanbacteria bacterium]